MKEHTQEELVALDELLYDSYEYDYATLSFNLNQAIYWLHYVQEDEIPDLDRKNLCEALYRLSESFHQAHLVKEIRNRLASRKLSDTIKKLQKEE